jgi:hypothetical protein
VASDVKTLREEARAAELSAQESFERCDTDGFLSQWASGLTAQLKRRQADLLEEGGKAWFTTLADLDGNWVPSKLVDTRYGTRWVLLDANGRFIQGSWMGAFPRRRSTMTRKGFREVQGLWPAVAKMQGSGTGLSGTAWVATVKAADDLTPPEELDLDFVPYGQDADK